MNQRISEFSQYYKRFENTAGVYCGDPCSSIDNVFAQNLDQVS